MLFLVSLEQRPKQQVDVCVLHQFLFVTNTKEWKY